MADMTKIAEMKQDICAFLQGKQGKVCVSFYDLNAGAGLFHPRHRAGSVGQHH